MGMCPKGMGRNDASISDPASSLLIPLPDPFWRNTPEKGGWGKAKRRVANVGCRRRRGEVGCEGGKKRERRSDSRGGGCVEPGAV